MAPKAKTRPQAKMPPFPRVVEPEEEPGSSQADTMVDYSYVDQWGTPYFCCHFASGWMEWFLAS